MTGCGFFVRLRRLGTAGIRTWCCPFHVPFDEELLNSPLVYHRKSDLTIYFCIFSFLSVFSQEGLLFPFPWSIIHEVSRVCNPIHNTRLHGAGEYPREDT